MKMKMIARYLSLFCGKNKGFVFTIDALIAVVIAVTAIAASSVYIGMSAGEPMAGLQMSRTGYDLLTIINHKGIWLSQSDIEAELSALLPSSYAMVIKEQCDTTWTNLAKANTETFDLPEKKEIVTGERIFVKELDYCRARFYIWLK